MVSLTGCASSKAQTEIKNQTLQTQLQEAYHKITPEEAKEMMDTEAVTILDVRTLQEYEEGHIPEAINLPNEEIGEAEPELLDDKDGFLLIYCRSGRRSREAAEKLVEMGYTQVYDFGGIVDWPYDTVKEE